MQTETPQQHQKKSGVPKLLLLCILCSFLIHFLLIWLIAEYKPEQRSLPNEPTIVTLEERPRDPSLTERKKEMELDEKPLPNQKPPEKSSRLAEENQSVEKEMAPRGDDTRDQPAIKATPETTVVPPAPQSSSSPPTEEMKESPVTETEQASDQNLQPTEPKPTKQKEILDKKLSVDNLTKLAPNTLKRMARNEQRGRIKERNDILEGDAVYLNLQHDYLISFFQRFNNRVESNWNYPTAAALRNEEGVLLLKITVTHEGELLDVDLLESSGSDDLDYEAIEAVYRAAPFGPITRHWPHEQMKIYAHFQYTLSNRYIFGR